MGDLLCMEDSMVMFHDEVENNEGPFWYHIDSGSCDPTLAYIFDLVATRLPAGAPPTSDPFCVVIACPGVDLAECSGTSTTTAGPPGSAMCCTDNNAVDALELKIGCSDDTPPAYDVYVRAEYSGEACRDADFTIEAKNFLAL
ncbi:MAG: hypothetical protein H6710_22640 [Myxococcales bacterium]|nr:hypothetical protein [Myxococcales bacterium]